ncbi:PQQ-dependent sugar dehydrogenase [Aquabacterium lacunae]|uniref:PQQ-dependent sugar dehydrogenase n=1 Tax=Aquabacterium lacunae TaxID=2528630 RepID=A0A4Q9H259_9BURK|nr:PQQ-dependent sugar dehydrogenase [Aquabacterium lacunae]TBO34152.1 PQQ-dependent sugar dehydrogenase [Aquabacterium lacunae]
MPHTTRGHRLTLCMALLGLALMSGCRSEAPANTPTNAKLTRTGSQPSVEEVARGFEHPWALAFLPDGRMLVSERGGRLWLLSADGQQRQPVRGLPPVVARGQGGLLDVSVAPTSVVPGADSWVYWTYSEPGTGAEARLQGTAVARGRLVGDELLDVQVVYRQVPKTSGHGHYGSRLVWGRDGHLFVTLGDRQRDDPSRPGREHAQNLGTTLGKVVRLRADGTVPADNPRWPTPGARPEVYSLGHRNAQGAALHPDTGELWLTEHGPQGGDELNRVLPGRNHGWPLVSAGCPYGSPEVHTCQVNGGHHEPDFEPPLSVWAPYSTAPSGLAFNTAKRYPGWEGHLFSGSLSGETLWRIELKDHQVVARQPLLERKVGRIRDVRMGPDGWLYLVTDEEDGRILRLVR